MTLGGRIPVQPWMTAPATAAVLEALTAGGAPVRFVGGCVRDAILGRPVADIDIAVPLPPEDVTALLEAAAIRAVPTGIAHGTVTAVVDKDHFEITSLRRDVETDGRHAKVAFTDDWEADARRRDFTINAIYCAPDGALFDPCGGLADLKAGYVRFVGEPGLRIREDALRILRFFRFHAFYGGAEADAAALAACRGMAPALSGLSAERVWSELRRLLLAPDPVPALTLMRESEVLEHVLPEARDFARLAALTRVEDEIGEGDPVRRLAALLGAGGAEVIREAVAVAARLRLSNAECARLAALAAPALPVRADAEPKAWRRAIHVLGRDLFSDLAFLEWAGAPDEPAYGEMLVLAQDWTPPDFPLTGRDALALGVPQGERVGELLARVEEWWMDGDFHASREACLEKLKELAGKEGETG